MDVYVPELVLDSVPDHQWNQHMTQSLYQLGWILMAQPSKQAADMLQAVRVVYRYSLEHDIVSTSYTMP